MIFNSVDRLGCLYHKEWVGARGKSITNSYSESFLIGNIMVSLVPWLHLHLTCNFVIVNKAEGPGDKATLCHWLAYGLKILIKKIYGIMSLN